ncbi:MAG TPA: amidohydrolase family protein [Candidatus Limnocylindrales bacterium]
MTDRSAPDPRPGTATAFTAELVFIDGVFREDTFVIEQNGDIWAIENHAPPDVEVVDFGEAAIFPGGVNTHTHSFQSLIRGLADELDLPSWLAVVYGASADYGPEECYVGAALSFGEMLRSGTTTVADFFYLNARGNENVRAVIQAALDLGIRLVMGRAGLDAEWGGRGARETVAEAVARFRTLADEFQGHPTVEISPAPHSLYGSSREMIEAMYELAVEFDTHWYVHVADPKDPEDGGLNRPGERTIPTFEEWGVLDSRLVLAHALFLRDEEIALVAERGASVACNPASGMFFGDGILDLPRLWRHGVTVGLATDGAASNNALNIFREAQVASMSQKLRAEDPAAVSASQIARLATEDGGRALGLPVGQVAPGQRADFAVLDILDFTLQPRAALTSNIVHAMSERAITHVYCGGRQVVRDGRLCLIDQDDLLRRAGRLLGSPRLATA